ncbi:hypothetical protein ACT453_58120, partial [Bacillus sp. D-CC]
ETFLEEYERESAEAVDENIEEWEKRVMSEVQIDALLKCFMSSIFPVAINRLVFHNPQNVSFITLYKNLEKLHSLSTEEL